MFLNGIALASASAQCVGAVLPATASPGCWLEAGSKLRAFRMFASADSLLPADGRLVHPAEVISRLDTLDPYSRVWAMEGIGYYLALRGCYPVSASDGRWPECMLTPLHTGAGLALSENAFRQIRKEGVENGVAQFLADCEARSIPSLRDAAVEALGLVGITLYRDLILQVGDVLAGTNDSDLFWHGVGRGLYFSPASFFPSEASRRRTTRMAFERPVNATAASNTISGLAWAITLVNIRDPEVIAVWTENLASFGAIDEVTNGLMSGLAVWRSAAPDDRFADAFTGEPEAMRNDLLRTALETAATLRGTEAVSPGRIGRLFRFRPMADIAQEIYVSSAG